MKNRLLVLSMVLLFAVELQAQNTIGVITYDPTQAFEGYNLFFPQNQPSTFLMDNCGRVVHEWTDSSIYFPGVPYLLPNGDLIKAKRNSDITGDPIYAGGAGGTVERRDWDNNLLWTFTMNDSLHRLHHDICPMPNGNIMMIAWEYKSLADCMAAGRDTAKLSAHKLWPDMLIEVHPIGTDSFTIVWQWHVWDHLIQDHDSTAANYGVVADHPELVDVNYTPMNTAADWMHTNSVSFNPTYNQVMISVPSLNEIWIIDHSTTIAEAAGHSGGNTDAGGDLIYRWGNPAAYRRGDSTNQQLFFQHHAHWLDVELNGTSPYVGKIGIFNNTPGPDSSSVVVINPNYDTYFSYYPKTGNVWGPALPWWSYSTPNGADMYASGLGSVEFLPNDNVLIGPGRSGFAFEITPNEDIVWKYVVPFNNGVVATQGDTIIPPANQNFRFIRFSPNYPAFAGRDLTPQGYIELNPDTTLCPEIPNFVNEKPSVDYTVTVSPNPFTNQINIHFSHAVTGSNVFEIYNSLGQRLITEESNKQDISLQTADLKPGFYLLKVNGNEAVPVIKVGR